MSESPQPDRAPPPQQPLLGVYGLSLTAGRRRLLNDLELELAPGTRLALVGPNGAGKSTLLGVLAGLIEPAGGRVLRPPDPPGMLFQDGAFWPHMSVAAHLAFVDRHHDPAWRQRLLETFALSPLAQARPEALSGGERLRLGLARALAGKPRWVLLDEPLSQLDRQLATTVREQLPELLDELGATVITVTHDADDVQIFGDRLLALTGSGSWWLGSVREALSAPPTAALAALAERGSVLEALVDEQGRADFGLGLLIDRLPIGRRVQVYLDQSAVRFGRAGEGGLSGCYMAPDGRGGCWVRVQGHLLRCGENRGDMRRGAELQLVLDGRPRLLLGSEPG